MKIHQKLIPISNKLSRPGIKMDPKYITIHETDNTERGADDVAHANLQYNGNSRQASWHFQVDDDSIYQSLPTDEVGWHAGDGNGPGNMKSIGIEICVNSDGNFKKAVENAVWLTRHLMKEHKIPASNVVQHNHWSGKNCPRNLRSGDKGITWNDFLKKIKGGEPPSVGSKPNPVSKAKKKKVYLPATDSSWRVYPTNKAPVKGNEKGFLNPKKFGGLSYDIIDNPQKNVYTIKTDDFGKVNIYAAPSTGAVIK